MSAIDRAAFSGGLFFAAGLAGVYWLYIMDFAKPLYQQLAGSTFSDQWALLKWAFPTACLLLMLVAGLYLVFGGVQEERTVEVRRRR